MENKKDFIIIGARPIGIACALECKKRGWNYLVLEKGALTNSLFNYPKNMTFFSTSDFKLLNQKKKHYLMMVRKTHKRFIENSRIHAKLIKNILKV